MLDTMTTEDLIDGFDMLDDWEDRYAYLIDLGRQMAPLPEEAKGPETKVEGCVSQVWLIPEDHGDNRLHFQADSDATLVRGLIAVLKVVYDGLPRQEVAPLDIEALFRRLNLEEHLSPNRRSGFFAIVGRLRALAATTA